MSQEEPCHGRNSSNFGCLELKQPTSPFMQNTNAGPQMPRPSTSILMMNITKKTTDEETESWFCRQRWKIRGRHSCSHIINETISKIKSEKHRIFQPVAILLEKLGFNSLYILSIQTHTQNLAPMRKTNFCTGNILHK